MTQPQNPQTTELSASSENLTAKKRLLSLFETTVHIYIGPDQQCFGMHKDLLCSRSGYFKGVLMGNSREAKDQYVVLVMKTQRPSEDSTHGCMPISFRKMQVHERDRGGHCSTCTFLQKSTKFLFFKIPS